MNYTGGMRIIKGFNKTSHQPFFGTANDGHIRIANYEQDVCVGINTLRDTSYGLQEAAGQPTEISWLNLPSEAGSIIGLDSDILMLMPKTEEYDFHNGQRMWLTSGGLYYKQTTVEEIAQKTPPVIYTHWKDIQNPLAD